MVTSERIKARAHEIGFELCGIAAAAGFDELSFIDSWIARRYYGTMTWVPRTARVRRDVRRIVPSARSVIVTGTLTIPSLHTPFTTRAPVPRRSRATRGGRITTP